MIDTKSAKWDFSKQERYAINFFNAHGFDGELKKQCISKTIFIITKDGISDNFELLSAISMDNIKSYMSRFMINWEMLIKLEQLRKQEM